MTLNIKSLFKEIHKKRFSFQLLGSGSGCHIKKELKWKAWPTFRRGASIKVNLDSMTLRKPLSRTWKIGLCTSNNGFSLPLFASADTTRSFPFLLLFLPPFFFWLIFIPLLHFIWIVFLLRSSPRTTPIRRAREMMSVPRLSGCNQLWLVAAAIFWEEHIKVLLLGVRVGETGWGEGNYTLITALPPPAIGKAWALAHYTYISDPGDFSAAV